MGKKDSRTRTGRSYNKLARTYLSGGNVKRFSKDAAEVLDFGYDWSPSLETDEVILTSSWAASSVDITLDSDEIDADETSTTVWVSDGNAGEEYILTNTITTDGLRTRVGEIYITVL